MLCIMFWFVYKTILESDFINVLRISICFQFLALIQGYKVIDLTWAEIEKQYICNKVNGIVLYFVESKWYGLYLVHLESLFFLKEMLKALKKKERERF